MSQPNDETLQQCAAQLVTRLMHGALVAGDEPENVWMILALAADSAERAVMYAGSVMATTSVGSGQRASAEYAEAKARLERLLAKARGYHGEVSEFTDQSLGVKRGQPQ